MNSICRNGKKLILKSIRKKISSEPVFFLATKRLWIPALVSEDIGFSRELKVYQVYRYDVCAREAGWLRRPNLNMSIKMFHSQRAVSLGVDGETLFYILWQTSSLFRRGPGGGGGWLQRGGSWASFPHRLPNKIWIPPSFFLILSFLLLCAKLIFYSLKK